MTKKFFGGKNSRGSSQRFANPKFTLLRKKKKKKIKRKYLRDDNSSVVLSFRI